MFIWQNGLSESERIKKNIVNLLSVKKGEMCMKRNVGINPDIIDKPYSFIDSEIYTDIMDMIEEEYPDVEIDIDVESIKEDETILEVMISNV